jgi:hypothetical protein
MAKYMMYITGVGPTSPFVYFEDYWYDPNNYWSVQPNSSFGVHSGTYLYDGAGKNINFFESGEQVMQFCGINYPDDCQNLPSNVVDTTGGTGSYSTPNKAGLPQPLQWFRYSPPF